MRDGLLELQNFLNKILNFFSLASYEVEFKEEDELVGGGIIADFRLWYNEGEDLISTSVPVMIRDADNTYKAFDTYFISPISALLIKKGNDYINLDEKPIINKDGKDDFSEGELDFSKISVAPLYYIYIASKVIQHVSVFDKKMNKDQFKLNIERTFATVFGREVSVFKVVRPYEENEEKASDDIPRIILRGKIFENLSQAINELEREFLKKKFIIPTGEANEKWRYFNETMIGRVDPFETPESEKIGLVLALVDNSVFDTENFKLRKVEKELSTSTLQIPFILHSDGARILMGSKNLKQALEVQEREEPIVKTKDNILNCGVNALVVYTPLYGFTFEDGIVVSKSFARKMKAQVEEKKKIIINAPAYGVMPKLNGNIYEMEWRASKKKGKEVYHIKTVIKFYNNDDEWRNPQDPIGKVEFYLNEEKRDEANIYTSLSYKYKLKDIELISIYPVNKTYKKDDVIQISSYTFQLDIVEEKPLNIGDKLTGRHGNKGIVSLILDDREMPKVYINGKEKAADVIISPLSVVSRMNLSQIYETHVSVAVKEGKWSDEFSSLYIFDKEKREKLINTLVELGSDEYGRFRVKIPPLKRFFKDAKGTEKYLTAGYQYILRLDHNVKDKFHAVGTPSKDFIKESIKREFEKSDKTIKKYVWQVGNPKYSFNVFTLQPPKGKKRAGGQKMGEMEFWTLLDHGAYSVLEIFNERNMKGFNDILKSLDINYFDFLNYILYRAYKRSKEENAKYPHLKFNGYKTSVELTEVKSGFDKKIPRIWREYVEERIGKYREKYTKKIISDILAQKEGYLRKIVTSRRLYNSARAVIVPRPDINADEIVLPHKLKEIWNIKKGEIVIVNRHPSLHRNSIQAFKVKEFWDEYAVGFPILACKGFNADFDGDTIALYYIKNQSNPALEKDLKSMLLTSMPFLQGSGEISMSIDQDIICGAKKKKDIVKKSIEEMAKEGNFNKIHDIVKKHIISATENGLTLSIFEIEKDAESFKTIKEYKCRGKKEQWDQLNKNIKEANGNNFLNGVAKDIYIKKITRRSRRSLLDKKLHVAEAGYFTRKLIELTGDIKIKETCRPSVIVYDKDFLNNLREKITEENELKEILMQAITGRYIKGKSEIASEKEVFDLMNGETEKIEILSPIEGCTSKEALGLDPATGKEWKTLHIGVLAGHTIGERGTQLSMQTFHTGGSGRPFNMSKIESYIYKTIEKSFKESKSPDDGFKKFILNMAKIDDKEIEEMINNKTNLLKFFNMRLVYFEILYYAYTRLLKSGVKLKRWFSSYQDRGILTTITFEETTNTIMQIAKSNIETLETHPRAKYFFYDDIEVLTKECDSL